MNFFYTFGKNKSEKIRPINKLALFVY